MKKLIFLMAAAILAFTACDNSVKEVSAIVTVTPDSTYPIGIDYPEYTVTLTNTSSSNVYTAQTTNGIAQISGIVPGVYSAVASATVVLGGFTYTVSGSATASILEDKSPVAITTTTVKASALVFKEIYTTGCKIGDGEWDTYFRDQFYEIYNNSTETVYLDGMCISTAVGYNYDFSVKYEYEIADPDKYIFCQQIWQIPGSGNEYPLKSGESAIIAQYGTDHKGSEILSNGKSPVNLSGVEFEAFIKESQIYSGGSIVDCPAKNLVFAVNSMGYTTTQWLTSVSGCAYVLFKPSTPLKNEDFIACKTEPYSTNAVREVLITDVIDAVERVGDDTRKNSLILPTVLDAGYIFTSAPGSYTGESIMRKQASKREDGTIVYVDTNNTTNDFEVDKTPTIRRNGAGVPSWNTWNK